MSDRETLSRVRAMWQLLETIHAVVYFAPEVRQAYEQAGLRGFWRGYFAGRAAPLGAASAEVVTAAFFNFHPDMVSRAVPGVWQVVSPAEAIQARLSGVDAALSRLLDHSTLSSSDLAAAADLAQQAVGGCATAGRTFFAAHLAIPWPLPAHLRLWHAATLLREHRGDGHIAANLAHGLDGLTTLVTGCAAGALPRNSIQPHRGWSDDQWDQATRALTGAGLLHVDGRLTDDGRAVRQRVEDTTDRLAAEPWVFLGADRTDHLRQLLEPIADEVANSGTIPYPNPMALPPPPTVARP